MSIHPDHIILDSGSQRSYITNGLKEDLFDRSERVVVKTFGSTDEEAHQSDVVKLLMKTTEGDDLELEFIVVPIICEALSGQVITRTLNSYPHLAGLNLAETGTGMNMKVEFLIGSDHYWKVGGHWRDCTRTDRAYSPKVQIWLDLVRSTQRVSGPLHDKQFSILPDLVDKFRPTKELRYRT